jgi:CRISPR system Cascade subunit CasA
MQFNLIDEQWIPVIRRDGTKIMIAPWEVTDKFANNPVVSLDAPRPDFNGALIQFLIGLVQTVAAPQNGKEWRKRLVDPPTPDELKEKFSSVRHAFELGGDGPRFMQDYDELDVQAANIEGLLIDEPGENALKNNTDFFVKRKPASFFMCPTCCTSAILTLQLNAPAGGRGYMTSLRGGGPLTTLVKGTGKYDLLWHTIWLNILESSKFNNLANSQLVEESCKFPWLAKSKASVAEQQMHPAQYFWATPRRIRLVQETLQGRCSVCSCESEKLVSQYKERPNGTKYQEPMQHPLSAFSVNSTKAVLTQPGGVSYRHWLGLVLIDNDGNHEPARVVHEYIQQHKRGDWLLQLWAFGYDFVPGQNKARCWYESTMPLILVDTQLRVEYEQQVGGIVKAASEIANNTRSAVKKAWFKRPGDAKGDTSFIDKSFWQQTETDFYSALNTLNTALEAGNDTHEVCNQWLFILCHQSLKLFDTYAWEGPIEDADPKRVVIARNELDKFNRSKKIKELLGLPLDQPVANKKTKTKKISKQTDTVL